MERAIRVGPFDGQALRDVLPLVVVEVQILGAILEPAEIVAHDADLDHVRAAGGAPGDDRVPRRPGLGLLLLDVHEGLCVGDEFRKAGFAAEKRRRVHGVGQRRRFVALSLAALRHGARPLVDLVAPDRALDPDIVRQLHVTAGVRSSLNVVQRARVLRCDVLLESVHDLAQRDRGRVDGRDVRVGAAKALPVEVEPLVRGEGPGGHEVVSGVGGGVHLERGGGHVGIGGHVGTQMIVLGDAGHLGLVNTV